MREQAGRLFRKKTASASPLDGVDVVFADLDGVVYRGDRAIPHAAEALGRAAESIRVGYITNNASRTDESVASQLRGFGLSVSSADVVTSSQAAARLLSERVPAGKQVLVVGGEGLRMEVDRAGYRITETAEDDPAGVVQGFSPDVGWRHLAEAAFALHDDSVPWIATNTDWTLPVARGVAPGNGTLVSAVHSAVSRLPEVAGKPERAIFTEAVRRFDAAAPLVIGDRLDTDILGANRAELASALVLTGIDRAKQLLAADAKSRPTYILDDLRQLHEPYPETRFAKDNSVVSVGAAKVQLRGSAVEIVRAGDDELNLLRAACALIWTSGRPIYGLDVPEVLYT